jgi:hypothetical protein
LHQPIPETTHEAHFDEIPAMTTMMETARSKANWRGKRSA